MMIFFHFSVISSITASVSYDEETNQYLIHSGVYDRSMAACGVFNDGLFDSGWGELHIEGNRNTDDAVMSYAAGIIEGYLTAYLYKSHSDNVLFYLCKDYIQCEDGKIPEKIQDYLVNNYNWVYDQVSSGADDDRTYALNLTLLQLEGIKDGYNTATEGNMSIHDLWVHNSLSNIFILAKAMGLSQSDAPLLEIGGHVVVGQTAGPADVLLGHNSIRHYSNSMKISKRYRLRYQSRRIKVDRRSFSSFPLMIHSDDSFIVGDSGLVLMSSGIIFNNYNFSYQPNGYPDWLRQTVAFVLSYSGNEFLTNYNFNSSTPSSKEIVVFNTKKFIYMRGFYNGSIYIIDEVPDLETGAAYISGGDYTQMIRDNNFLASFNVPIDEDVFSISGYKDLSEENPYLYSYYNSTVYMYLQKKGQTISSFDKFKSLLRANNPKLNSEQNGTTSYAMSPRYDLDNNFNMCFGAVDSKLVSVGRSLHVMWEGQLSPSHDDLPLFNFEQNPACKEYSYAGLDPVMNHSFYTQYFDIEEYE